MGRIAIALQRAVGIALALFFGTADAQQPSPLALPNLELHAAGQVHAIVRLPDGSAFIGGQFSSVYDPGLGLSIQRDNLAKLTPAGGLDFGWEAPVGSAGASVEALVYDGAGSVYVGGIFSAVRGHARTGLAKLAVSVASSAVDPVDPSWNPSIGGSVLALAVHPLTGTLVAGGDFATVTPLRYNLARFALGGTGALDATWNPFPADVVHAVAVASDGSVFAGGAFENVNGTMGPVRSYLAKFSGTGAGIVDPSWDPSASAGVNALALDAPNDALFVGGSFTTVGGQPRSGIAKLSASGSGTVDATWNPGSTPFVIALAIDGAGSIYVGGFVATVGGAPRANLAKLATAGTGALDVAFDPAPNAAVLALAASSSTLYAGGRFAFVRPQQLAMGVARFASGVAQPIAYAQAPGNVRALARGADGRVYVGGRFDRADGAARQNLLRLDPSGALDAAWNPGADQDVLAVAVDAGAAYAGGLFARAGGLPRRRLARLALGDGAADPNFDPAPDSSVSALLVGAGGYVYVGGAFTQFGVNDPLVRRGLARINPMLGIDSSWDPNVIGAVQALAEGTFGEIYLGGAFSMVGDLARRNLARVASSGAGALDLAWNPSPDNSVYAIAVDPTNGDAYVGGDFAQIGGQTRARAARVLAINPGFADPLWDPNADDSVFALAVDGANVFAGGRFANVGGAPRPMLAKLARSGVGAADPTWNPMPNGNVAALAVNSPGALYVGGYFVGIGAAGRRHLAALPALIDGLFKDGFEGP